MNKELEHWRFIDERLKRGETVMLLVVAESSGSSPGRRGYKMAVAKDGELFGSIGGGVMEVKLVEESRQLLAGLPAAAGLLREQVHRKNAPNSSGMICSGEQTVIFKMLTQEDAASVDSIVDALRQRRSDALEITASTFHVIPDAPDNPKSKIQNPKSNDFIYTEKLGFENDLYIIGGGHCALALSALMSKMDFHISLFDDRPELNTIAKNEYAHVIKIVDTYGRIGDHIFSGRSAYVVVMTLGYKTDGIVIRSLIDKEFKYFGVLGSRAKMATMFKELRNDGIPPERLDRIRTPIGLPINSHTPEEIAVSIAAEIISVKNG